DRAPTKAFERAPRDPAGSPVRRDVARHGEGTLAHFLRQRLGAFAGAGVHHDPGGPLVEARCGSSSEAAPRTGNYGDAPCKISVFHPENCFTVPEVRAPLRTPRSKHQG